MNQVTLEPVLTMSPQASAVASFHCTRYSAIGSRPFVCGAVHDSVAPAPPSIGVAVRSVTASGRPRFALNQPSCPATAVRNVLRWLACETGTCSMFILP